MPQMPVMPNLSVMPLMPVPPRPLHSAARRPLRRFVHCIHFFPFVRFAVAALFSLGFAAGSALAHHGWSEYDAKKSMTLTGAIVEYGYDNPHGFVVIKAGDRVWRVILAPPSRLDARGLPRTSLKPGMNATVVGYPHRREANELRAERITLEGGSAVELR